MMPPTIDPINAKLLQTLQESIPLVPDPFAQIAAKVGISEADVLARISQLKQKPGAVIRQISAIFDSGSLGYKSTLVAAKIAPDHLEEAARIVGEHPGVSHNYQRAHDYNLWYTLAVPPDSKLGLQGTLDVLHQRSGAISTRMLPTLKLFKIGVKLNLSDGEDLPPAPSTPADAKQPAIAARELNDTDKRMIRVLQQDMPIVSRPFDVWAGESGVSVDVLLASCQEYLQRKWMRRFSAVLHHRQVGFSANAMGVWAVPEKLQESFGASAAKFPEVSHCYLRPSYPDWPFNIFTMVHAKTAEECEKVLASISKFTGITQYGALYSTREFKKVRVKYFLDDIPKWEAGAMAGTH